MFKGKKYKSDVTTDIKKTDIKKIEIAVDNMFESGEIEFDVGASYYLVAINSDSLIILKSDDNQLIYIKNSLVNQKNFFITLADGVEMFVRYNDVYSFSIKRIYSYEQLRKIIKAREDDLEIGGWTDELAEHIEQ